MSHILLNTQSRQENIFRPKGEPLLVKELILPNHLLNTLGEMVPVKSEKEEIKGQIIITTITKKKGVFKVPRLNPTYCTYACGVLFAVFVLINIFKI